MPGRSGVSWPALITRVWCNAGADPARELDHVPEIIIKEVLEKMEEENILMFRENEVHEI